MSTTPQVIPAEVIALHEFLVKEWSDDRNNYVEAVLGKEIKDGGRITRENVASYYYWDSDDIFDFDADYSYGCLGTSKRALEKLYELYPHIPGRVNLFEVPTPEEVPWDDEEDED